MPRQNRLVPALLAGAVLLALSACTGPNPSLEAARSEVTSAQADPDLQKYAPGELALAGNALQDADNAYTTDGDVDTVNSKAYVASQAVAIARASAEERRASAQVADLGAERERVRVAALKEQLAAMQPKETPRGLVVTVGDVLFDTASATLRPGGVQQVQRIAEVLVKNPAETVLVEGHADSRGSDSYNMALSQRRADSVRAELVYAGVPADRIIARGMGEGYPVTTNETAAGQQQNRRVEIVIQTPPGAPMPQVSQAPMSGAGARL
jgi:outer membrane protein OmpA-like peptidoglycan-associated protein